MKILTVVFCLMLTACATTESYYRLHQTNDPVGDFLGILFVAATIADVFSHNHSDYCDH